MPSFSSLSGKNVWDFFNKPQAMDGLLFAKSAIEFTSLGCMPEQKDMIATKTHLFQVAIELALKSLALRSGATVSQCENAGHVISKIFSIIEGFGIAIPELIKRKLSDDKSSRSTCCWMNGPAKPSNGASVGSRPPRSPGSCWKEAW
jgi:hypothetical protein